MHRRPRGSKTRKERLNCNPSTHLFSACAISLINDININLIYRNIACFAGKQFFIIGSKTWHKGATNGLEELMPIRYFKSFSEFKEYNKAVLNHTLIAVEQSNNSVLINKIRKYPKNPCFIFGNEAVGLGDDVLLNSSMTVEIPMDGYHPCVNVGCASAIVFYDFVRKNG